MNVIDLLDALPVREGEALSYGDDIDRTNNLLFSAESKSKKEEILRSWVKRNQPCMFGRIAASNNKGLKLKVYVIDESDIAQGVVRLEEYLQVCRKTWKQACAKGESDAVLYFFNLKKLVDASPSDGLVEVFKGLSDLIFQEYAPVSTDVIYTEAAPLVFNGKLFLYKAGVNFFHTTAHNTANHDRRVPGGAVISINSVGHYANNLIRTGLASDLDTAIESIKRLAWQSIGNGGHSLGKESTTSWHNIDPDNTCPFHDRPSTVPEGFSVKKYSAWYHTDVLIPEVLTRHPTVAGDGCLEKWKWLTIEYFTSKQYELGSIDFGMFHGYPVDFEALLFNPFPPIRALNSPSLVY
ncbi:MULTISPECIES: hypothetical protein [Pseudomonas]|uniref:hypothetical protein n=1 Tax=Pseudomonas TaxID=286 RepID=UPI0003581A60|nr:MULTISPECIES: hypothetical protein [Pseudomonas]EPJ94272.1 hypothetical protein CF149_08827 [Pseudomonas psychrophila]KOX64158.1 hypothetical protein AA303_15710 [Pseudomonas psychrophila]MDY7582100.1 hypothetical protein [Pseudomonas sp. CCI3.1]MEB0066508.1 hypothetical protein [Pseudomonas sp. CCI3.1]MEB0072066.1 hypothetical protein [Pseudomonas sp. CCI1.4]